MIIKKMQRYSFLSNGLKLSYLDAGGAGKVLIALHAHWMEAATFIPLAAALAPEWRVIALDQRGHGNSDHAKTYTREDYVGDLKAFFDHLHIKTPPVLLGSSLGGINAYQFAAQYPTLVRAIVIEDIGVEYAGDMGFCLSWAGCFRTRDDLIAQIDKHFLPCLQDSIRETSAGWRLAFDPHDMILSNDGVKGSFWPAWLATRCPVLLIRGSDSRVTTQAHLESMAARRPHTTLKILKGGHILHIDNPVDFTKAVCEFLETV